MEEDFEEWREADRGCFSICMLGLLGIGAVASLVVAFFIIKWSLVYSHLRANANVQGGDLQPCSVNGTAITGWRETGSVEATPA